MRKPYQPGNIMRKICPQCESNFHVKFLGVTQEHDENNYIFKCTNVQGHSDNSECFFKMQKKDSKISMIKKEMLDSILKQRIECPKSQEHEDKHFEHEFTHIRSKGNKDRLYCNNHDTRINNQYEFRVEYKINTTLKKVLQEIPTITYYKIREMIDEFENSGNSEERKEKLLLDFKTLYKELPHTKELESNDIEFAAREEMLMNTPYSLYERLNPIYMQDEKYDIHKDTELLLFALHCININQSIIARIFHVSQSTISKVIKKNYGSALYENMVTITMTQKDTINRLWHHKVKVSDSDFEKLEETWKSIEEIIYINP